MKTYRKCLADAYAMEDILQYICNRIDGLEEEALRNQECLKEDPEDDWREDNIKECLAKVKAFEDIISKITK